MISCMQYPWNDKIIEISYWLLGIKEGVGEREVDGVIKGNLRDPCSD